MNLEQARTNMIDQQIRSWEVLDSRVLEIFREIPREAFVPVRHRKLAFSDLRIPLGHGQFMMKPIEQGRLLQGQARLELGVQAVHEHRGERGLRREHRVQVRL